MSGIYIVGSRNTVTSDASGIVLINCYDTDVTSEDNDSTIIRINIKEDISKIDYKVPLYDEYTKNLYIIPKELAYKKVTNYSYRFPNKQLKHILKLKRDKFA